jgi:hypothetical protein
LTAAYHGADADGAVSGFTQRLVSAPVAMGGDGDV